MKATGIKQHLLIGFLALFSLSAAQTNKGIVIGMVIDAQHQPIEYATAALINAGTNEIEKGTMCDGEGTFTIDNVACGEYVLSVRIYAFIRTFFPVYWPCIWQLHQSVQH